METNSNECISISEISENVNLELEVEKGTNSIENFTENFSNFDTTNISMQIDEKIENCNPPVEKVEIENLEADTKENGNIENETELEIESEKMENCQIEITEENKIENSEKIQKHLDNVSKSEVLPPQQENSENSSKMEETQDSCVSSPRKTGEDPKTESEPKIQNANTSLAFLADAYNSSDSENEESKKPEEKIDNCDEYRNELIISSSDDDSDSDSSTESDKDSPESSGDESEEDEDARGKNKKLQRTRNKIRENEMKGEFDDLPPIEELQIVVPEVLCDPLGEVGWMVEQMVVVKPKPEKPTLNLDTVLFLDRGRRVLGRVFDVFGQVSEPHYCVRFNSSEHITQSEIKVGMTVYFCPNTPYTSVVFLHDLLKMKATEEISDQEHPEFSDDAEEKAYYAALNKKQTKEKPKSVPNKRQRTGEEPNWRSNHPWSSGKNQEKKNQNTYRQNQTMEGSSSQSQNSKNQGENSKNQTQNPPPHFWQHSSYNRWPISRPHGENNWPNSHPYNEQHNRHQIPRFYQQQHQQVAPNPYNQNVPYQNNLQRFPMANFPWHSQVPRFPGYSWPFPPPPPPGV